jgi:hypothetical protein
MHKYLQPKDREDLELVAIVAHASDLSLERLYNSMHPNHRENSELVATAA